MEVGLHGWRLKRRGLGEWDSESLVKTFENQELQFMIHEILKPGVIADIDHKLDNFYLRIPFSLSSGDLEKLLDLFFRVLQCRK